MLSRQKGNSPGWWQWIHFCNSSLETNSPVNSSYSLSPSERTLVRSFEISYILWWYRVLFLHKVCFQGLGIIRGDLPAFPCFSLLAFLPPSQDPEACPPHPSVISQRKTGVKLLCCLTCSKDEDGHQHWSDLVRNSSGLWAKAGPMELDLLCLSLWSKGE